MVDSPLSGQSDDVIKQYLGIELNDSQPALRYDTYKHKGQIKENLEAVRFFNSEEFQGLYAILKQENQCILIDNLIDNLRGSVTELTQLPENERDTAKVARSIANLAMRAVAKRIGPDKTAQAKEQMRLAAALQDHLQKIAPKKAYSYADLEELASHIIDTCEKKGQELSKSDTKVIQYKILANLINALDGQLGDLHTIDLSRLPTQDRLAMRASINAATLLLHSIHSKWGPDTAKREEEKRALLTIINGYLEANYPEDVLERKTHLNMIPPELLINKICEVADRIISPTRIKERRVVEKLQPGEFVRISMKRTSSKEKIPRSVLIYKPFGHDANLPPEKIIRMKKRFSEKDRAMVGQGGANVIKNTIVPIGSPVVLRKALATASKDELAVSDHAINRFLKAKIPHVLLPLARGKVIEAGGSIKAGRGDLYPKGEGSLEKLATTLDSAQANKMIRQILGATCAIHSLKMAHRDLKPDNILLINNDAYVMDFDTVVDLDENERSALYPHVSSRQDPALVPVLTQVGTVGFAPPEAYGLGKHDEMRERLEREPENLDLRLSYNQAADSWALGAILFQLMNRTDESKGTTPMLFISRCLASPENKYGFYNTFIQNMQEKSGEYYDDFTHLRERCLARAKNDQDKALVEKQLDAIYQCFNEDPEKRPSAQNLLALFPENLT